MAQRYRINPFTGRMDIVEQDIGPGGDVEYLTGNAGGAVPPTANNINILGAGAVNVTGVPGTSTLTVTVAGGGLFAWSREAGAAVPAVVNHGYINTNVGLTTFTLPLASAVGDMIEIVGESAAGWTIAQNAGQNIQNAIGSTTIGVGGSLSSTNRYDTIRIVCRVVNTTWHTTAGTGVPNIV